MYIFMKKLSFITEFCLFFLLIIGGCSENKKNDNKVIVPEVNNERETEPEFNTDHQYIVYKEVRNYDIKGEIYVPMNINNPKKIDYACQLEIYNYGDDIKLYDGYIDDIFSAYLGTVNFAHSMKENDNITITRKNLNKKYGEWALADVTIQGTTVNDVFITPLAMKAYKRGNLYELNFIQLVNGTNYLNVILVGDPKTNLIISMRPDIIITQDHHTADITIPENGPGRFWH